jgi:hypothetical protein
MLDSVKLICYKLMRWAYPLKPGSQEIKREILSRINFCDGSSALAETSQLRTVRNL